jgi:hypothetical protein
MVVTEWPEFAHLDWARIYDGMLKPAFVFDGRNILKHAELRAIGFDVYAIGKPLRHAGGGPVFPTPASGSATQGERAHATDVTAGGSKVGGMGSPNKVISTH